MTGVGGMAALPFASCVSRANESIQRIEHFPLWEAVGFSDIVHVLRLINFPLFPCVALEPLPPLDRELMLLAAMCTFFFKNTFYPVCITIHALILHFYFGPPG